MKSSKFQYILSILTYIALIVFVILKTPNPRQKYELFIPYASYIFAGFLWTIFISICVFLFSFIFGGMLFLGSRSKVPYIRYLVSHLTTFMFGSPLLVIVIVFYFFVSAAFGITNKLLIGIFTLTLYFSPFVMKLYQGAYESIDEKQFLVCDIFGFTKFQMYYYIIFPQIIKVMLPPLSGHLATVIKSSSLLYLIGFRELYYTLTNVQAKNLSYTEGYILMIVLYLIITVPLLKVSSMLEERVIQ